MNGAGARGGEFLGGAYEVKQPSFRSQQQGAGKQFGFHSVLDNVQPSGNGSSTQDRSRMYRGGKLASVNGVSENTDSKRQWLDSPYRTFG